MTSVTGNILYDLTLAMFDVDNNSSVDNNNNSNIFDPFNHYEYISSLKQEYFGDSFDSQNSILSLSDKSCQDLLNVDLLDWTFNIDSSHKSNNDHHHHHNNNNNNHNNTSRTFEADLQNDDFRSNPCSISEFIRDYNLDIDDQVKDSFDYEYLCDSPTLPNISSFINPCDDLNNSLLFTPSIHHSQESSPIKSLKNFPDKSLKADIKLHFNTVDKKHFVKRPKKTKATHLWKFMRSLLDDPAYNPSFIRWENKDKGVFRIVPGQSKNIAKLWGIKKNNPTMTFDKLSRSLRWCREYGFLSKVPNNEGFPKKLCFRFGDRAMDWNGN